MNCLSNDSNKEFIFQLEPYMTESFILSAFHRMGESPISIKVMRNKYSGEPAGYCFVHFQTDEEAVNALHKLSGKMIPNTQPVSQCLFLSINISRCVYVRVYESILCICKFVYLNCNKILYYLIFSCNCVVMYHELLYILIKKF